MIIATAGHVDHGKTSLVRALTGVDTDRLAEEKRRGLTIDLGFAYLPTPDDGDTIGFVDVPGHERFIKNALCGLTGADFILFVIAADDGPMPQTEEHLAIVDLMGIKSGAIAITKIDKVDPERLDKVTGTIDRLFSETSLANAPRFQVSAQTHIGVAELKTHLSQQANGPRQRERYGRFRLAVDRKFHISGAGLVATGTVFSGRVQVGDTVCLAGTPLEFRVRGIHAQNAEAATGSAGQRCALNLTGGDLRRAEIERGHWLVAPETAAPVSKFDANLRIVSNAERPFTHWTPVHIHVGADETTGRIALLDRHSLPPGTSGLAQVTLDKPIGAVARDTIIVRDQSARATLGGGDVVDIFPPQRGRAKPERLAFLRAVSVSGHEAAFRAALENSPNGLDIRQFQMSRNLTAAQLVTTMQHSAFVRLEAGDRTIAFSKSAWSQLADAAVAKVTSSRDASGRPLPMRESALFSGTPYRFPRDVSIAIARKLANDGKLINDTHGVRTLAATVGLDPADTKIWDTVQPVFRESGLRPLTLHDLADRADMAPQKLKSFLSRASRLGLIVYISPSRVSTHEALIQLGQHAETIATDGDGTISVAAFRDRSGVGRNAAIEILEYFDKRRLTRRNGNARTVIQSTAEALGANHR